MERSRHVSRWLTGILLLPVLYLLSFMPLAWAVNHELLDIAADNWAIQVLDVYTIPIQFAHEHGPAWVQDSLTAYGDFLQKL